MRPSILRRILAPLVAVWFVLAVGDSGIGHRCPVHDAPAPAAPTHDEGAHHGASDDDGGGSGHDCCTCVGHCTTAGLLAALAGALATASPPAPVRRLPAPSREADRHPSPRLLPFANGPPQASA